MNTSADACLLTNPEKSANRSERFGFFGFLNMQFTKSFYVGYVMIRSLRVITFYSLVTF